MLMDACHKGYEEGQYTVVFISLFTDKTCPQQFQVPEISGKAWSKVNFHSIGEDQVRKCINKLDTHRSMSHNEMHPHKLRELADVGVRPLSR